jgi:poly-gamma-glutamate synthesis protein (capsule biosynthesis protein)
VIHTSNEVSFAADCPYPDPNSETGVFCARDSYFELLKVMRLNVVELTGNHVNDWGVAALNHTLDVYDTNKIVHFGGGRNLADARQGITVTHNGNRLAFVGCNPVGPSGAWAAEKKPGAAPCDDAFLSQEIPRLRKLADIVIMTIQYQEYYQYTTPPDQQAFFKKYARMGAQVVIGSQAHQPQGFALVEGAFIHYGLGNLYFDQMNALGTRQMFIDKLIMYDHRHLSTVLFTGLIEDYSRPRPMTETERADFLRTIFQASGW